MPRSIRLCGVVPVVECGVVVHCVLVLRGAGAAFLVLGAGAGVIVLLW